MSSTSKPNRIEHGSWLMTAYQFAYFTIYQAVERISFDKYVAYRSAVMLACLQGYLTIVCYQLVRRIIGMPPPMSAPTFLALLVGSAMLPYIAVYERGAWREYAASFKQWPRRKLVIGRAILLATVAVIITLTFAL